jgi:hypothetical protein
MQYTALVVVLTRYVTVIRHQIVGSVRAKKSKSAEYYASNPKARAVKNAYAKKYDKQPRQRKRRAELVKINRKAGTYGNGDGKDYDHTERRFMSAKRNRAKK